MKILKKGFKIIFSFIFLFIFCHFGLYVYCSITPKIQINRDQSYYLFNDENEIFYNNYSWVSLDNISNYLIDATISTEDKHFYQHFGFDYIRIGKAIFKNVTSRSLSEGASTITQQYARNIFLNYDKTWKRKIDEAILAFELETHYTKDEILEGYLNTINYGGVLGIENASLFYFNKSAKDLTLAEASILAGIPQSPSNYSLINNFDKAKKRQKVVLTLMKNNNKISDNILENTFNEQIVLKNNDKTENTYYNSYFKDTVLSELKKIDSLPKNILSMGGIKIYTTLNDHAQESLIKSVDLDKMGELETAGIMMNPNNGEIMALLGGKNYVKSQYNRAVDAKRQVGSTMKPFLYYSALENGFTSASSFISEKTSFSLLNNQEYTPKNYNDKYANGPLSMGAAIAYSDNVYAVKTHLFLGEETLVSMANRLGITKKLQPVPSLALGTEEISLLEMVSSYSTFANLGNKVNGHTIRKIEDSNGNVLYEFKNEENIILNKSLAFILNNMLTYTYDADFINYNYPTLISLLPNMTHKYSIKSGTTDTDMWIIGYNKDAVLGIWTGYDDNSKLVNVDTSVHKNIWCNTMESYFNNIDTSWYDIPDNIVGVLVDPITGSTDSDGKKKMFYFLKGTEPRNGNNYDFDSVFKEENEEIHDY